jgi:hypothetical protein
MLLFDLRAIPAQSLKSSVFESLSDRHKTSDTVKSESKERFVSIVLLLCILGAALYGEILSYAF